MRFSHVVVPIGSFVLAVLLSMVTAPVARHGLRAADDPTGTPPPPCATWEITKHVGVAKKWHLRVKELPSTLINMTEPVFCEEWTWVNLQATVSGKVPGGMTYDETPGNFRVLVHDTPKDWGVGNRVWDIIPQSVQLPEIKRQIRAQFVARAVDLLGNPLPGVVVHSLTLDAQDLRFETVGLINCKNSMMPGVFSPRPLTYAVDAAGDGGGTN